MEKTILIKNIKTCYTSLQKPPVKGENMKKIKEYHNAYIVVKNGLIHEIGSNFLGSESLFDETYDAYDLICIPGLIDSHTHLVFGGSREDEFAKKIAGMDYLEILKQGGGILNTVAKTKEASFEELYNQAKKSLNEMLLFGVTSIEAKSGYGLNLETEIKLLKVLHKLNQDHPIDIHITYLGAHAIPKEYLNKREEYILSVKKDLSIIKKEELAEAVDVFCEIGAFNELETKDILEEAKRLGFKLRVHTDEINSIGGAEIALNLEAKTVDHLMAITDKDMDLLAKSNTIANLLPSTSFFLNKKYAKARMMIEKGIALALSSDYNPGSTPSENYQLTLQLAGNKLRMLPYEILTAATINPAYSLDISDKLGSIEKGKLADLVLLDAKNLDYFIYHYGINHTKAVFKNGNLVVNNRQILEVKR